MPTRLALLPVALLLLAAAPGARAGEPAKLQAYALIVAGESGEASFAENYKDWTVRLHKVLTDSCKLPAAQVVVLAEKKDLAPCVNDVSNKGNVIKALNDFKSKLKPGDQFLLFLIGHGTGQNKVGKLCLPGPDFSDEETADWLNRLNTREVVLVNSATCSDTFVDKCSNVGRVILTATNNPGEGNETYFMEFLLKGFESKAADQNKNGVIDLLEAFNYAATECPKWYVRQYFNEETGAWRVEGKQSRELWKKFYGKVEDKKLEAAEQPDADDAEPVLGEWGPQWDSRRMPTEHAQLDDNGDRLGTAVFVNNQFMPIPGSEEGADGWYARKLAFGKPSGNTDPPVPTEKKH